MKRDNLIAILIFFALGICPLVAGLAFFWGAGQISVVTCTRLETTHVNCSVERAFLGRIPSEAFTVTRVTGAELETNCGDDSCTYSVNLLTNEGYEPLTGMATSDVESAEAEKERIDAFLNNTEAKSIEFSTGPTWLGMVLTLPFIALGAYITIRGVRAFLAKST